MKTEEYKAGDLDLTFGDDGAAYFRDVDYLFGMTTDTNDNTYAAGRTHDDKFYVARITADGKLDTNFGGAGYVIDTFLDDHKSQALTVNIDQQGRILITGDLRGWGDRICVARFTPDGSLDETFADKGKVAIPPPSDVFMRERSQSAEASSLSNGATVLSDGKILIFWKYFGYITYLVRLTEKGELDLTFNGSGYVKVSYKDYDLYPSSVNVIESERLIVGTFVMTQRLSYGLLVGYDLNGQLDRTFAKDGYALLEEPSDAGSEIWNLQQVQGHQIWAIGRTTAPSMGSDLPPTRGFLTRLNKDGHLDTTFNLGKPVLTPAGFSDEWIAGALQDDGKIVLAGSRFAAGTGMLGRYRSDGSLDADFGENGIRFFPSGGNARLVILQKDGRILAGGAVSQNGSRVAAVLRYHK
ncbi:hypothetical protein HU765_11235 [Pseudomonas sp. SWRI81]|uniref:hypothetical protein n=1 Tax=Pseudomonas sp. SWRI81 TaxID=2745505 RepID=UPI00164664B7|nr:hypothetical protein [Pseudomonas sp. SWRI81]MBC3270501.1 hypothetical protein [Pseudomonas sp. SWRI81]